MKKILLSIIYFLTWISYTQPQTLYGTTFNGGKGGGTINKLIPATNNLIVANSFESFPAYPVAGFIQANDGKLYGMTSQGGDSGTGVIFFYDPSSTSYTKVKDFDRTNGGYPTGSLMQANNGKLYGMNNGGSGGRGVIFSFDPLSSSYTKLKDFDATGGDGANPSGGLIQASDGKLYGMTGSGGNSIYGNGVIFSFDPSSSTYTKLKDFDNPNGANPNGNLIEASDGKLYGMTTYGGKKGRGVIFSYDPLSFTYEKLKDFDGTDGAAPTGSLIQASDGKLYGVTSGGGTKDNGVIFSFDPSSLTYSKLKDFDNVNGGNPSGSLVEARDGKLYGMTAYGGNHGYGVAFSFDPLTFAYAKLKDFDEINGRIPTGSLLQARDGKIYGMTAYGGTADVGTVFSFDPSSSTFINVMDIASNETGSNISASLMQAGNGKLYGMTYGGGSSGRGVIFSFDPSSSTYTKLKNFDGTNGANPYGSLTQARDGKLYGMTSLGGSKGDGVIFSFDPLASTYRKLKDLDNTNGANPYGSLVQATDGKLYGMTTLGGSKGYGVIFSYNPSSSTYTKLKDFDSTNGRYPYGSLMQASNGKLYGMTVSGGINREWGVIFSFDPSSSTYTKLKDFDFTNGGHPLGSLAQASDGKLYGLTSEGGSSGFGVIFSFDPSSFTYTKLRDFDYYPDGVQTSDYREGGSPFGSLMLASDGKLYGMTYEGGSSDVGVIFSYDPSSSTYTQLKDFNFTNGANPYFGSAFIEVNNNQNKIPNVSLTSPANNTTRLAPAAHVRLSATASDTDGTITKVEFYNGNVLLHTETVAPYAFVWRDVPVGNYTLTAKAYDNSGLVSTSVPVHISVVPNKPPIVSLLKPHKSQTVTAPGYLHFEADARDLDGKIARVEFYNGSTLLRTEYEAPYTCFWPNVSAGIYTITAVAVDNWGAHTTSEPVAIRVVNPTVTVANKSLLEKDLAPNEPLTLSLTPNPANQILNVYTEGLTQNKPIALSLISSLGTVVKTMHLNSLSKTIQINISSLASGVYTIKLWSGNKIVYKEFVKI